MDGPQGDSVVPWNVGSFDLLDDGRVPYPILEAKAKSGIAQVLNRQEHLPIRPSHGQKNSSWPLPCPNTHCSAHVDDKSGPGGLLPGEIPSILNICADRESLARCPVDFYAASLS